MSKAPRHFIDLNELPTPQLRNMLAASVAVADAPTGKHYAAIGSIDVAFTPGDRIAAIGTDLTVGAQVRPRFGNLTPPESAWLEWTESGGDDAWHRVAMPVEGSGPPSTTATRSFAVTLPRLTGSLTYRVASGSALSRSYRSTALEPPAVAALAATVEPPAYTRLAVANVADPIRIDAWEGSRVTLNVTASRPVTAIDVQWPAAVENAKETTTTPGSRNVAAGFSLIPLMPHPPAASTPPDRS